MLNAKQSSNPHTWLYIHRLCSDRSWLVISLAMLLLSTGLQPAAFQFLPMKSTIGTRLILCRLRPRRVTTTFSDSAVCFQLLLSKCSEIRKIQLLTTLPWVGIVIYYNLRIDFFNHWQIYVVRRHVQIVSLQIQPNQIRYLWYPNQC